MNNPVNPNFSRCIDVCMECSKSCAELMAHCKNMPEGATISLDLSLVQDCAEVCKTIVGFLERDSRFCKEICALAAEICEKCASECENMGGGDEMMKNCAEACRRCAVECRRMASV